MKSQIIMGVAAAGALLALSTFAGSWYTVDEGERGVLLRYGSYVKTTEPGLNFKLPFVEEVKKISTQARVVILDMESYSRDQQPAQLRLSVNYRLVPSMMEAIYSNYGGEQGVVDRLIARQSNAVAKNVFGTFSAAEAIQQRGRLNADTTAAIQAAIEDNAVPGIVIIDAINVEEVTFSQAYEDSIEERMRAEVAVARERQTKEQRDLAAQINERDAQAVAFARREQGAAEAQAIRDIGQAEAEVIRLRGEALAEYPLLIELIKAEKWTGSLPTHMLPEATVPFLNVQ